MKAMNQPEYDTLQEVAPSVAEGASEAFDIPSDFTSDFKGTAGPIDSLTDYVPDFLKNIHSEIFAPMFDTIGGIFS